MKYEQGIDRGRKAATTSALNYRIALRSSAIGILSIQFVVILLLVSDFSSARFIAVTKQLLL